MKNIMAVILFSGISIFATGNSDSTHASQNIKKVEIVIEKDGISNKSAGKSMKEELKKARILSTVGLVQYGVGLGLKYINLMNFLSDDYYTIRDRNKFYTYNIMSTTLQVSGPIMGGVGASITYNNVKKVDSQVNKNTNWKFAAIGLGCAGGSNVASFLAVRSVLNDDVGGFALYILAAFGLNIASDALLLTSVINAKKYTSNAPEDVGLSSLEIKPFFDFDKHVGVNMSMKF